MEGRTVSIVLDANLVVALLLPLPYSNRVWAHYAGWREDKVELLAPTLLQYEANAAIFRSLAAGWMQQDEARTALEEMQALWIHYLAPSPELHTRAWYWADRLGQSKTYDAQYVALAELERAELWTADRRLANGAHRAGAGWVHWIGANEPDRP
jgi:predicted nucleic acid-binding protein